MLLALNQLCVLVVYVLYTILYKVTVYWFVFIGLLVLTAYCEIQIFDTISIIASSRLIVDTRFLKILHISMPFKIIKVFKNGTSSIEVVPSNWEKDGKSWWPQSGLKKKQKDEFLHPDNTFYSLPCERDNLETYKKADEICTIMEQQSDTDDQEIAVNNTLKSKSAKTIAAVRQNPSLRDLISVRIL